MAKILPGGLRRCMTAMALPALLGGCAMIGPDFVQPKTPEVSAWLEANAPSRDASSGLTSRSAPVSSKPTTCGISM